MNLSRIWGFTLLFTICLWSNAIAEQYQKIYFDDFVINTLADYTYAGHSPLSRVSYDTNMKALAINLGDNVNFQMFKEVPVNTKDGYFEIKFMPYRYFPFDGISTITVYDSDNNYYHWHFSRDSNKSYIGDWKQYRARVIKRVNAENVIYDIFVPTPDSYSLNEWHTLGMKFSPEAISTYIDDIEVGSFEDPRGLEINVSKIGVGFMQQSQYLGHIKLLGIKDVIDAEIDIDPDTLNLDSKGKTITCYIELPKNDVSLVDLATIKLADGPLAKISPSDIEDVDEDGFPDIMVKFDREEVIDYILQNEVEDRQDVELTVEGKIADGTRFVGSDIILIMRKDKL